eukprot:403352365
MNLTNYNPNQDLGITNQTNASVAQKRLQLQRQQQKDWLMQQIQTNERLKGQSTFDKKMYDEQTLELNRLLKESQDENEAQRKAMLKAQQEENLLLAKQKRDTDLKQKQDWLYQENHEVDYTQENHFMTENPMTTQSQLAPHRVKPYHFKGLNEHQKQAILYERDQQISGKQQQKQLEQEQDKLWALQQEHLRRLQVLNDRDQKRKQREVAENTKNTHSQQIQEHMQKWKDPYNEKGPL